MITTEKREEWLRHLTSWKASGLSVNRYCMKNGLNKNSFRYWIDRDKGKIKTKKSFVKLNIPKALPKNVSNEFSLRYGSFEIKIPPAFNKSDLENLLEILESRIVCS